MFEWKLLKTEEAAQTWDENLLRFSDYSPFQMYAWGEYKKALGWRPIHLIARDESGEILAMMLGVLRRYPFGIGLFWCEGGPVGELTSWNRDLQETITRETDIKRLYCRIRCDRERTINDALELNHQGWMRSWFTMNSSYTMVLNLEQTEDEMLKDLSSKWRRNLRLSKKENIKTRLWKNPDIDEIYKIFAEMQELKNLPELFSREEFENLFKTVGGNLICIRSEDENGELIAVRLSLLVGEKAVDYLAATTLRGRKLRASYLVFWSVLQECKNRGIKLYDIGGIDPFENPGVYTFKKQTGAKPLELLGEWDRATSTWMRWFGNWAIWRKDKIRNVKKRFKNFKKREQPKLTEELIN